MELTLETLQSITTGAVSVTREDGWFCFRRFSRTPDVYFPDDAAFQAKVTATASVTLDFLTDARQLNFQYRAKQASSRHLFFFDLYVNGCMVASQGCADAPTQLSGQFCRELPPDQKRITLYFPNLYAMMLNDIFLEGGTEVQPLSYAHTMICYGDSITQGYDATYPSLTYANRLAFSLNARMLNKGIGGDVFHKELIDDSALGPDIVTVAYGTNDWAHCERSTFLKNAESFLTGILETHPDAQVFVITPIWRRDSDRTTACGKFEDMAAALQALCRGFSRIHVIDGLSLTAHVPELLVDHVHPGELGHVIYGANLSSRLMALLSV